jgi:type VI secretion system protein ImpA
MPSPPILDFEVLLRSIAGENPAGKDVRYEGTYDVIKEARRADDALAQGEWVREIKMADWAAVIEIATETLATKSKDLQVASWLTEALVKRYGFPGLRDGFRLIRELQGRFWDALYPEIEDSDLETRAAPLVWLNEKLPVAIRQVPITQGVSAENYAWLHWKESREVDNLGRQNQEAMAAALADGKITGEQFDKAVEATPLAYYKTLYEDLSAGWAEFKRFDRMVEETFGREAPSLMEIQKSIEACHTLIADMGRKRGGLEPDPPPPHPEPTPDGSFSGHLVREGEDLPPQEFQGKPEGSIRYEQAASISIDPQSRADALRRLAAVAAYFRRTEPHSPVSYLIQRAVRWGEMPLEQWLQDVISNEDVLGRVRETLGLKDSDTSGGT